MAIRTGWRKNYLGVGGAAAFLSGDPGLGLACCEWLPVTTLPPYAPNTIPFSQLN